MIEPTREQLAKIDHLGGIYDSVECRPRIAGRTTFAPAQKLGHLELRPAHFKSEIVVDVVCWHYRPSGAKIVAHALTIHPDGTESDRR